MKQARLLNFPWGMGDGIWILPILRALHREYDALYFETPWPQLYWDMPWCKPLWPLGSDAPYASWPMYRESAESVPPETWVKAPNGLEEITVCATGDYSTRLRSFYHFDGPADMHLSRDRKWHDAFMPWYCDHLAGANGPKVLMHLPTQAPWVKERDQRYCDPVLFQRLFDAFSDQVKFFDVQRLIDGENELLISLPIPVLRSNGARIGELIGSAMNADAIVTTDNHMLPLALSLYKPTLYLAGGVSVPYLLDRRLDSGRVEVVEAGEADPLPAFKDVLRMVA